MTLATIRKIRNLRHELNILSEVVLPYRATEHENARYDALKKSGYEECGEHKCREKENLYWAKRNHRNKFLRRLRSMNCHIDETIPF